MIAPPIDSLPMEDDEEEDDEEEVNVNCLIIQMSIK